VQRNLVIHEMSIGFVNLGASNDASDPDKTANANNKLFYRMFSVVRCAPKIIFCYHLWLIPHLNYI